MKDQALNEFSVQLRKWVRMPVLNPLRESPSPGDCTYSIKQQVRGELTVFGPIRWTVREIHAMFFSVFREKSRLVETSKKT